MFLIVLLTLSSILLAESTTPLQIFTAEDANLHITQLARKYGYEIEEHSVITQDGYILGLHRLKTTREIKKIGTVFLMHGLLDSSDTWLLQGPGAALGYLLVDSGYDVWMGNARGNKHSLRHTVFFSNLIRFWKFSWEEIGVYDLPAMIDYVIGVSGTPSVYYIGHSQGTTSFFVMNAQRPEYSAKIKMMFALSPVAWMSHAESPVLRLLSRLAPSVIMRHLQFVTSPSALARSMHRRHRAICAQNPTLCNNMFELLFGTNHYVSHAMLQNVLARLTNGASILQFDHYVQLYRSGRFCRYDHGLFKNLNIYGTVIPPAYNLNNVRVPIVLMYSGSDPLSHPTDVATLYSNLPNVHKVYYVENFNHNDYIFAPVAKETVYDRIIDDMRNFDLVQ